MAIKALLPTSEVRYVLKRDPARGPNGEPVDGSTVFVLRTLDGYSAAHVRDSQYVIDPEAVERSKAGEKDVSVVTIKIAPRAQAYEACRIGIACWENFQDADGKSVPFETENATIAGKIRAVVAASSLARLEPEDALELSGVLMQSNNVSATEEKK